MHLILRNSKNHIIFQGKTTKLSILQTLIKEKSMAWFQDPDPCFIHQSAVRKRLLIELEDEFMMHDSPITIHQIKQEVVTTLSFYEDLYSIETRLDT